MFHAQYLILGAFGIYDSDPLSDILDIQRTGIFLSTKNTINRPDDDSNFIVSFQLTGIGIILLLAFGNYGQHFYFGVSRNNTVIWHRVEQV